MKIHKHILLDVLDSLEIIFEEGKHADKVIEKTLKSHSKWGGRDRKFYAESVYEIVRHWRYLWFLLNKDVTLYRDNLFEIFGVWWFVKNRDLLTFPEMENLKTEKLLERIEKAKKLPAIENSFPDWMAERLQKELGDDATPIMKSLNQKAEVVLRVNKLKTDILTLQQSLLVSDIETELVGPEMPDAIALKIRKNVFITTPFKEGHFEMQDGSSQRVAYFMKTEPGLRIIDACAGAGGKTLHIASLMKNKGKVIAMDVEDYKLAELKKRVKRAGIDIVETKLIDSTKVIKRLYATADRVLLDVPCSGIGVLRRNPDTKWKMTEERLEELRKIQKSILQDYSKMVKKGGYLVYSTCSLLPSENREQVDWFLENNPGWEFEEDLKLYPHKDRFDGFYIARMIRKN
jgi:16S rRNA (cytosine967-C5)-methyltransferase